MVEKLMSVPDLATPRVVLVRHGESEDNLVMSRVRDAVRGGGSTRSAVMQYMRERVVDPGLSADGVKQAEMMGKYWSKAWKGEKLVVWCGPMLRNLQTMRALVAHLGKGVEVICRANIYELQGVVSKAGLAVPAGMTLNEIREKFPEVTKFEGFPDTARSSPWNHTGYERRPAQLRRVHEVTRDIRTLPQRSTTTIVISHADFQSHLVAALLRLPNATSKTHRTFTFKNTSVTSLRMFPSGDCTIEELDNAIHLHNHVARL